MNTLKSNEVAAYKDQGFVVPKFRLSDDQINRLIEAMDRVVQANPEIRPERFVSVHIPDSQDEGVVGDSTFLDICRDDKVVDVVEQVLGPDVILWGCSAFCKPPGDGMEVFWHQDAHYWPISPLATCTVWIAIDDSVVENGCLRVIPGSHQKKELYTHLKEDGDVVLDQRLQSKYFDESTAVDVELKAGQMSLHDVYMIHGSNPNYSARRRAGIAIRYMPGSSFLERRRPEGISNTGPRVDFSTRPLWLVRGQDLTGKNDFTIGH